MLLYKPSGHQIEKRSRHWKIIRLCEKLTCKQCLNETIWAHHYLIWQPPNEALIESITCLHTTQWKWIIPCLLGHCALALSSRYLEKGDRHLISHLWFPSFDATFHQHIAQSKTECLIRLVSLEFITFDSPYFDVVKSYTLFCSPTCNSCELA